MRLVNPKDGSEIFLKVNSATVADVDTAVSNARAAFAKGPWSMWPGKQRAAVIYKLAELIEENAQSIAYLESISSGRIIAMLLDEITRVANSLRCVLFPIWKR